jgi:acyl-CoA synthetase (AMP-forming)/AMP-acid ligase II
VTSTEAVLAELTGPGGRYEIVREDVLGVETQVYRERMRTLRELVAQSAARADVDFVVQGDAPEDRLTFGAHDARARAVATSLAALGVGVGDRVALCSANNPDWVVTFWACAVLGAVLVPLNAWWKAEELEFGLNDAEAKILICDERRMAVLRDSLARVPSVEHVFVIAKDPAVGRPFSELADGRSALVEAPLA